MNVKCDCLMMREALLSCFNGMGPWAGTVRRFCRAYQAGTVRILARRAVLGPKARHETRRGTARKARRAVPARPPAGHAWPGPGPGPTRWPTINGGRWGRDVSQNCLLSLFVFFGVY